MPLGEFHIAEEVDMVADGQLSLATAKEVERIDVIDEKRR